jgi:hypothetical protein
LQPIALDHAMREALLDQKFGIKIAHQVGTNSRARCPAKYITYLDFAKDIMLISDNPVNPQKQQDSVDVMAH